ncbi:MAG TPA: hypothetical protein PLE25_04310, partial [Spirochaetales bacterium]|nr:hypothetical protein [Spirochaetales bacterium]
MDRVHTARPTVIVSSLGLALAGAALFVSLVAASLGAADGFGGFLLDGLSWAAYALPAYPWLGAVIIAMPGFRYDLLIGLLLSLLPFASLAATARFLDDPTHALASYPAIAPLGILGVAAVGLCLTLGSGALVCLAVVRARAGAVGSAETEAGVDAGPAPTGRRVSWRGSRDDARAERETSLKPELEAPLKRARSAHVAEQAEPPVGTAADGFETRAFDLSYPDLPPVPFLASMAAPEPESVAAESADPSPTITSGSEDVAAMSDDDAAGDDNAAGDDSATDDDSAAGDDDAAGDDEPELL